MSNEPEIIEQPPCATQIMAATGLVTREEARIVLRSLAKAGFVVAPLEPTNVMFEAYLAALNMPISRVPRTIVNHIGKARKRWKAMAKVGMAIAFSDRALTGNDAS